MEIDSAPVQIDEPRRSVDRLKLESELALKKEKDERRSKQRLAKSAAREEHVAEGAAGSLGEKERAALNSIGELKEKLGMVLGMEAERCSAPAATGEGGAGSSTRRSGGSRQPRAAEKSEDDTPMMAVYQAQRRQHRRRDRDVGDRHLVGRLMQGETAEAAEPGGEARQASGRGRSPRCAPWPRRCVAPGWDRSTPTGRPVIPRRPAWGRPNSAARRSPSSWTRRP